MKIVDNFIFFWGGWLSNFHPCRIVFGSKVFKSSEQLFMYLKALHFGDTAERILLAETPKEAKTLGLETLMKNPGMRLRFRKCILPWKVNLAKIKTQH